MSRLARRSGKVPPLSLRSFDRSMTDRPSYTNPPDDPAVEGLFDRELKIVNIGIDLFADELERLGARVVRVDWRPPAGGDPKLATLLGKMSG